MSRGIRVPMRRLSKQQAALVAVAVVVALASAAVLSSPAKGSQAAANGRIVFQSTVGNGTQLFTINPDGTGMQQVTHISGNLEFPNWAPDGSKIIFDSDYQQTPTHIVNVYTVNPDGSGLSQVPIPVGPFDGAPAYSPDGTMISFDWDSSTTDPHTGGIDIASANGSNPRRVTIRMQTSDGFDTTSNWSPNGQWLAFERVRTHGVTAIFKVRVDGTGLKRLTRWSMNAAQPRWSPDGKKILFYSHDDANPGQHANIYTVRPNGSHLVQLTHFDKGSVQARGPDWSPDGKWIVWHRRPLNGAGKDELYIMQANGKHIRQLTHLSQTSNPSSAAWAPTG
jgi:TolB protein